MSEEYKQKAKAFLERHLNDYEIRIKKLKKKRKVVKALFIMLIIISITSSTVCAAVAGFTLPPFIIPILSTAAGLSTAFSVKFNLESKKTKLNRTIDELDKIKHKIDYVVSCNGNFTEAQSGMIAWPTL
jgi:hypothetical protein